MPASISLAQLTTKEDRRMRLKMGFLAVILTLAALLFLPCAGFADIVPVGNVFSSNSWGQGFQDNGYGPQGFNKFEVFLTGPGSFEGMSGFSLPGWTGNVVNPDYMEAQGNTTGFLSWNLLFRGNPYPVNFAYLCWDGDKLLGATELMFDGSCWTSWKFDYDWHDFDDHRCPVPLPPTVLLLGSGLLGLIGWRRLKT